MVAKLGKRSEILKQNYRRLREAGFSSAEATRFRGASEKELQKAISAKALPQLREEKRTAVKVKVQTKEYKTSSVRIIEITGTTDTYLKKVIETFRKMEKDGYNYYSVRTTTVFSTGEEEVFQTQGMTLTSSMKTIDQLGDVLTQDIEDIIEAYSFGDERRITQIKIEILFWKAKK